MRSDLKVLVAGPKGSGKTAELIRICHDMNLPFVVRDEKQCRLVEHQSIGLLMPIKIKFVGELMEDGYEGPIVIERGGFFTKLEWVYIQSHCVIYAESKEAERVIVTNKSYTPYFSWMFAGCVSTSIFCYFGGLRFAAGYSLLVVLIHIISLFRKR